MKTKSIYVPGTSMPQCYKKWWGTISIIKVVGHDFTSSKQINQL